MQKLHFIIQWLLHFKNNTIKFQELRRIFNSQLPKFSRSKTIFPALSRNRLKWGKLPRTFQEAWERYIISEVRWGLDMISEKQKSPDEWVSTYSTGNNVHTWCSALDASAVFLKGVNCRSGLATVHRLHHSVPSSDNLTPPPSLTNPSLPPSCSLPRWHSGDRLWCQKCDHMDTTTITLTASSHPTHSISYTFLASAQPLVIGHLLCSTINMEFYSTPHQATHLLKFL